MLNIFANKYILRDLSSIEVFIHFYVIFEFGGNFQRVINLCDFINKGKAKNKNK